MILPIFYRFCSAIFNCFRGVTLLWHALAIVLTYICLRSGFDWSYFVYFQGTLVQMLLLPAVGLGGLLPILVPLFLFIIAAARKSFSLMNTAYALAQAALLGSLISSTYKAFTGRIPPHFRDVSTLLIDHSHGFRFGFMEGGIFWGWPSSHTTIAFATAIALVLLYPRNKWIKYLAPLYALYVGLGVSMSIHWFSDFLAGMIIGSVIGVVVGKAFLLRLKQPHPTV